MKLIETIPAGQESQVHSEPDHIEFADLIKITDSGTMHGLLEFVQIQPGAKYAEGSQVLAVNESGLLFNLPYNQRASLLAKQSIIGDAAIVEFEKSDLE